MKQLDTHKAGLTLYQADALELCAALEPASVDLILTDPPYYRVKDDEAWDKQWATPELFLAWVRELCGAWRRVLKPNGSLYVFASPQMAARVECVVRESFNVLSHVVWVKHDGSGYGTGGHSKVCKEALRAPFPQTERIILAEQVGADGQALAESRYLDACMSLKRSVFGDVLAAAMRDSGLGHKQLAEITGAYGVVNHGGAVSNWLLGYNCPTKDQWSRLRRALGDRIPADFDALCREYERRKSDVENERTGFEALRRPFRATEERPYTDVWDFATVADYPGKHPCEKPQDLLQHIITTSSREGAVVLDCFCGSGSTGEAALALGRQFIGGDASEHWSQYALARLERRFGAMPVTVRRPAKRSRTEQPGLALEVA